MNFFFSELQGRPLKKEHNLLYEIAQYYQTKDSTEALARQLLDFWGDCKLNYTLRTLIWEADKETVNWKLTAYNVLLKWLQSRTNGDSLTLLRALEKTNWDAFLRFQDELTGGKGSCFQFFHFQVFSELPLSACLQTWHPH